MRRRRRMRTTRRRWWTQRTEEQREPLKREQQNKASMRGHAGLAACLMCAWAAWPSFDRDGPKDQGKSLAEAGSNASKIPAAIYRSAQGPGPESAPRSAFWVFFGICLGVPPGVFFGVLGSKKRQKALKKHSLGHSEPGPKSTPWGTFRPGALSSPVNGGRNRKAMRPRSRAVRQNHARRWGYEADLWI